MVKGRDGEAVMNNSIPQQKMPVRRRNLTFDMQGIDFSSWHPRGPQLGHLFSGLSMTFPAGEQFFVDSVRNYMDKLPMENKELLEQVRGFMGQEAMHSREHNRWNEAMEEAGYPARKLERITKAFLGLVYECTHPFQLGVTIAAEHVTAMLAGLALEDKSMLFEGVDKKIADFWQWHAIEETEHKAVAFDVYQLCVTEELGATKAYLMRVFTMLLLTLGIIVAGLGFQITLSVSDKTIGNWRGWWRFAGALFVRPGLVRKLLIPYLTWYLPGFHPWRHDNAHLVQLWKAEYEQTAVM